MRLVMAGGSGFLGTAWRDHLAREGHDVVRLVRGEAVSAQESHWDPYAGVLDQQVIEDADAVTNLGVPPLAGNPHSSAYRRRLRDSRVTTTRVLSEAVASSERVLAFLAQNGTAFYGDRGDEVLTEDSGPAEGSLLTEITQDWQAATEPARQAGARVCVMRTGVVLHKGGGAFQMLSLLFRAGLGGPLGDGAQYFPTISLADWVRAATFLATHDGSDGVYNLVGPNPTTNAEFTRELGRMLHRPTVLRVPATPIRMAAGRLSGELLGSCRVEPARLLAEGFAFEHATLNARLASALTA